MTEAVQSSYGPNESVNRNNNGYMITGMWMWTPKETEHGSVRQTNNMICLQKSKEFVGR